MRNPGTGARPSKKDPRTVKHSDVKAFAAVPLITGGVIYDAKDIDNQHHVGICTAISRTQLRTKQTGKRYSPDFQYLCQKKFYDMEWNEGSSLLNSQKVAKAIGFLPAELWTWTTETDRSLPYAQYIAKLQAIPDAEITRLKGLCVDAIKGYAFVDNSTTDPQAVAHAIVNSPNQAGIQCRYDCGPKWWTPSWLPKDIDPLKRDPSTGGHAICMTWFDYTTPYLQLLANTWGNQWCLNGSAHINWNDNRLTEAWVDLLANPMFQFNNDMGFLSKLSPDVKELQKRLGVIQTGFYGLLTKAAVIKYQAAHGIPTTGFCGPLTRASLNQ